MRLVLMLCLEGRHKAQWPTSASSPPALHCARQECLCDLVTDPQQAAHQGSTVPLAAVQVCTATQPTWLDQSMMSAFMRYCIVSISLAPSPHRSCSRPREMWSAGSHTSHFSATALSCQAAELPHASPQAPQGVTVGRLEDRQLQCITCSRSKSVRLSPLRAASSLMTVGGSCRARGGSTGRAGGQREEHRACRGDHCDGGRMSAATKQAGKQAGP